MDTFVTKYYKEQIEDVELERSELMEAYKVSDIDVDNNPRLDPDDDSRFHLSGPVDHSWDHSSA